VQGFDAAASDVTAAAAWSSAGDAGVAIVQSPGYFKTLGTGVLDIRATANGGQSFNPTLCSGLLSACGSFGYYVAPQAAPERMILLVTSASRLSGSSFSPIAGATVEVAQPQRTSVCVTNGTDPCTFWVFDATIRIKATASGYGTSDQTLFGPLTDGSYAIPGSPRVPCYLSWPVLMYPPPPGGAGD
jgi:hypothetical protein